MAAKRRTRRPVPGDSKESGRNGGNAGSDVEEEEESGESGEAAMSADPKAMPLKQADQSSPPSPKNAGAQCSGEASPARSAPCGGAALKAKKTTPSKRVKKPPPASREGDEAEDSGDAASPARGPLPNDDTADAGHKNKRAATPKRGVKRSPPPRQEEERPEKRAVGRAAETAAAASAPRRKKKSKRSGEKDRRKKKKDKKQLRKTLFKLTSSPEVLESGLNDNREDTPSSPDIALDDEHNGREMAEQEQSNTAPPQDEHGARGEQQQEKKNTEQEHAGDTSAPRDKDMHSPHGEEEQEKEVTNQEHADDAVNGKTLQGRNAPSAKLCGSETEKKPWSYDDELKILNALVAHAQSHGGDLPDSAHLLANLTFDKIDANEEKLTDKIRKLKTRYRRWLSQGCPSDGLSRRLFKLSETLWGQVGEDERAEPRDFSVLSKMYPHLAKEVKAYAESHSSGDLIMAMFMTIGDEKARDLDAKCKKQQIEAFKLELGKASLTNELLSALSLTRVKS